MPSPNEPSGTEAPAVKCSKEVLEEREAILKLIEETAKLWKDGDAHQMAEVLTARIRART